ncbi:MAG TPA: EAL domain-containing protein [Acidimicrobiales bacterium]|nr:EAL domain-containing protein [Acidimicrobiales bacterium]
MAAEEPVVEGRFRLDHLLVVVGVLGLATWLAGGAAALGHPVPAPWRLAIVACAGALADLSLVYIRFGHHRYTFTWAEPFVMLSLVIAPSAWALVLMPPMVAIVHLSLRRPRFKAIFNGAVFALSLLAASAVYSVFSLSHNGSAANLAGLVLASAAFYVVNATAVSFAVALSQHLGVLTVAARTLSAGLLVWAGNTAVGVGLVYLYWFDPSAMAGMPLVLAVSYLVYRAYLSATSETATWQLLQSTSRRMTQLRQGDLVEAALSAAEGLFEAEWCEVMAYDGEGPARASRRARGGEVSLLVDRPERIAPTFWPRASSEREIFCVSAATAPAAQRGEMAEHDLGTCLVAPLILNDRCVGMLRVGFRGSVKVTARERQVLITFANQLATSVANAALFERTTDLFERYRRLADSLGEGVISLDEDGVVTFANPAAANITGLDVDVLLGRPVHDLLHGSTGDAGHPPGTPCPLLEPLVTGEQARRDDHTIYRRGASVPVAFTASPVMRGDRVAGAVIAMRDMTERRALEAQLTYQAFHDPITDTANRALFLDRLQHALDRREARHGCAVLFIDLDHFKVVNDSLGHRAGDLLLRQVAQRVNACLRPEDTLARFGGDEFTVLLEEVNSESEAVTVATRIVEAMSRPFRAGERDLVLSVSLGVALGSAGRTDPQQIVHESDVAMYQAKSAGRDRFAVYAPGMGENSLDRFELQAALRRAIDLRELSVHYQPIVDVTAGRVSGVEALLRWQSQRGLLPPSEFIGLAEDTGLILPLGRLVLEEACQQVQRWKADHPGLDDFLLSVNLSPRQFQDSGLVEDVASILLESGLPPHHLCLEITESAIMADVPSTVQTMDELKGLGVRLAIDDFGTGYSSLSYLKRFPVDVVKIDRSFITGLGDEPVDTEIVAAVIRLTGSLGMSAVAEGVETSQQLGRLRELGCPLVQGHLFAAAQPAERVEALIVEELAAHS